MDKGIYCLVFRNPACTVGIGALGTVPFRAGFHVYVGSALGSGGLVRLDRHIRLACNRDRSPKWHVDHLLLDPRFELLFAVWARTTEPFECRLAESLSHEGVTGFGCSDCTCASHLFYRKTDPEEEIVSAFRCLGLIPAIKTIITSGAQGNI